MLTKFLGNISDERIEQLGERLELSFQDYRIIEEFSGAKGTDRIGIKVKS
jgi:hypothetical protein